MKFNLLRTVEILDYSKELGSDLLAVERQINSSTPAGVDRFYVYFDDGEVMENGMLLSDHGNGNTINEALKDYANRISGKRLAFYATTQNRIEVVMPKLVHTKYEELEAMIKGAVQKNIKEKPVEYLDSTGKVIDQPEVFLVNKRHPTAYRAIFRDGRFHIDEVKNGSGYDYEFVKDNYYIAQTGDRIACYRTKCVFNKNEGCDIKPMLTIRKNLSVTCGSEIIP